MLALLRELACLASPSMLREIIRVKWFFVKALIDPSEYARLRRAENFEPAGGEKHRALNFVRQLLRACESRCLRARIEVVRFRKTFNHALRFIERGEDLRKPSVQLLFRSVHDKRLVNTYREAIFGRTEAKARGFLGRLTLLPLEKLFNVRVTNYGDARIVDDEPRDGIEQRALFYLARFSITPQRRWLLPISGVRV